MRTRILATLVLFLGAMSSAASAALIVREQTLGGNITNLASGGQRWELGNNLHCLGSGCSAGDDSAVKLAVGDTFVLKVDLGSIMILTDSTGFSEVFRGFLLSFPAFSTDVSSIQHTTTATLLDRDGSPLASLNIPVGSATEEFGISGALGLEGLLEIELGIGDTLELRGWVLEVSILSDPQSLLENSLWPWHSFAIDAQSILLESLNPPAPPTSVSEPSTLAIFAFGLAGLGFFGWRRKRTLDWNIG